MHDAVPVADCSTVWRLTAVLQPGRSSAAPVCHLLYYELGSACAVLAAQVPSTELFWDRVWPCVLHGHWRVGLCQRDCRALCSVRMASVAVRLTSHHVLGDEELGCCRAGQHLELGTRWSSVAELCGSTRL